MTYVSIDNLNLSTIDILCQTILCCRVYGRMFGRIPATVHQ